MKIGKMKIELKEITIRELVEGYKDEGEAGVIGFAGKLDIRPAYQREFIYEGKNEYKRDAVIDTIVKNFPLNVMYWAVREDGGFEIIDGQQRTVSICQFVKGDFSLALFGNDEQKFFNNLEKEEKEIILDYRLMVYHCSGTMVKNWHGSKPSTSQGRNLRTRNCSTRYIMGLGLRMPSDISARRGVPPMGWAAITS